MSSDPTARSLGLWLTAVVLMASPVSAQESIAGTWVFTMDTPQGVVEMAVVFAQDGNKVTGAAELDIVESAEISDGVYEDGKLSFLLRVGFQGQWFTVEMEAEVDGDQMTGQANMAEVGASSFTAKKSDGS